MGGAHEVAIRLGPGSGTGFPARDAVSVPVDQLRAALAPLAGRLVRTVEITAPAHPPVEAFGIVDDALATTLVFANTTAHPLRLPVGNLPARPHTARRISDTHRWETATPVAPAADGTLPLDLAPFEVCVLVPA